MQKSYDEINAKLKSGQAVVVTAEEVIDLVQKQGIEETARTVDVVTTATFAPMCSSGAFLNFGHADPPIRMTEVTLNQVPAYAGIAAVDAYIGATELSRVQGMAYGGAHVIQDLVDGKEVELVAKAYATDCYPRTEIRSTISKDCLNQAYLFNPRNAYQNYAAATNSSDRTLHTYMGTLQPNCGNVTYQTAGELSPLLNDPYYRTIGIGTRIFLGGAQGFVAWEGTQHNPNQERGANGVPIGGAGSIAVIGDLKAMNSKFLQAAVFRGYGVTLLVGIGIPIPILDEEMLRYTAISNREIYTDLVDFGVGARQRPVLKRVNYAELRSGEIELPGRAVKTITFSSLTKARVIAQTLKAWLQQGQFMVEKPVQRLPLTVRQHHLRDADENEE